MLLFFFKCVLKKSVHEIHKWFNLNFWFKKRKKKYHPQTLCNNKASILMNNCVARSPHNVEKIFASINLKGEPIATPLTYWYNSPSNIKLYCLVNNVNNPLNQSLWWLWSISFSKNKMMVIVSLEGILVKRESNSRFDRKEIMMLVQIVS